YDKSVLLLEGVEGDTLEQKIQANDPHVPQYYEQSLDLLTVLWNKVDRPAKDLDYRKKTRDNLENSGVGKETIEKIIQHGGPIWNHLSELPTNISFDYHPENLIVAPDGTLVKIDNELNPAVPFSFNLANLLIYTTSMPQKTQLQYVRLAKMKLDDKSSDDEFLFGYLGAVFQRALSLSSAWSTGQRDQLHSRRGRVVACAIEALDYMESNYLHIYNQYAASDQTITTLKDGLISLQSHYSMQS
ncbi:MAG: hypothetical protein ACQESG_02770, partial [Nanobdellota archaeon]